MSIRVLSSRPPRAAPLPGALLSLAMHVVLVLGATIGTDRGTRSEAGDDAEAAAGTARDSPGGERLYWVGVGPGPGSNAAVPRPGLRPPVAYVVPGRSGDRAGRTGARGARERARRATGLEDAPATPDGTGPSARRAPVRAPRLALLALPDIAMPDVETTILVAGVLTSAPDLTRRVSRPEDFAVAPRSELAVRFITRGQTGSAGLLGVSGSIDELPIPLIDNPPPLYPDALARARVDGQVVVEFRIDSIGLVEARSLRVVASTNVLFTDAVRRVLPQLRFLPAQRAERAVGVTVRQPFLFTFRGGG